MDIVVRCLSQKFGVNSFLSMDGQTTDGRTATELDGCLCHGSSYAVQ